MNKDRLTAFTDGVVAFIITIMVLDLTVPHGAARADRLPVVPFTTDWLGENQFARVPTSVYGVSLLMPAIAYYVLQIAILRQQGPDGPLAKALGGTSKARSRWCCISWPSRRVSSPPGSRTRSTSGWR
jgi:uncharacterized membrane protein